MNPGKKVRLKDKEDERALNQLLDEMQRDLDDRNFKARGVSPSSEMFRRVEVTFSVEVGDTSAAVNHALRDENGAAAVPNRWRVVDVTGQGRIWRDADIRWTNERVAFRLSASQDATYTIELWRA